MLNKVKKAPVISELTGILSNIIDQPQSLVIKQPEKSIVTGGHVKQIDVEYNKLFATVENFHETFDEKSFLQIIADCNDYMVTFRINTFEYDPHTYVLVCFVPLNYNLIRRRSAKRFKAIEATISKDLSLIQSSKTHDSVSIMDKQGDYASQKWHLVDLSETGFKAIIYKPKLFPYKVEDTIPNLVIEIEPNIQIKCSAIIKRIKHVAVKEISYISCLLVLNMDIDNQRLKQYLRSLSD